MKHWMCRSWFKGQSGATSFTGRNQCPHKVTASSGTPRMFYHSVAFSPSKPQDKTILFQNTPKTILAKEKMMHTQVTKLQQNRKFINYVPAWPELHPSMTWQNRKFINCQKERNLCLASVPRCSKPIELLIIWSQCHNYVNLKPPIWCM